MRSPSRPLLLLLLSLLLLWSVAGSARADSAPASPPEVVLIRADDQREHNDRLFKALAAQLSGMKVQLVAHRVVSLPPRSAAQVALGRDVAAQRGALAVFWVDASVPQSDTLHLFIAGKRRDRVLIRAVDARIEDRYEALAVIARTAVRALLSGGTIGVELPPKPSRLAARLGYLFGVVSAGAVHHAVSLELALRLGPIELGVGGAVASDVSATEQQNTVETRAYPVWLALRWPIGLLRGRLVLAPSATLGFDINDVNVAPAPGFAGRSQGLHLGVYLAPSVTVTWRVTARVGIFADLAAALYVRRLRYVVADPGGQQVALAPWTAQPLARIGLVISIF